MLDSFINLFQQHYNSDEDIFKVGLVTASGVLKAWETVPKDAGLVPAGVPPHPESSLSLFSIGSPLLLLTIPLLAFLLAFYNQHVWEYSLWIWNVVGQTRLATLFK